MIISAIYKIQSIIKPERTYIGSARNVSNRWSMHLYQLKRGKHHSIKLQRHYDKYGENDLRFSILEICNKNGLFKQEQFYLNLNKPYFNICTIANSLNGIKRSAEFKEKMRKLRLGKKMSDETKKKISNSLKGENNILFGKHLPEETKQKIGLANKNIPHGFKKGHQVNVGRKQTKEWRDKWRESMKGRPSPLKGRKRKNETIEKIRLSKIGNRYCLGRKLSEKTKRKIIETRMLNKKIA